MLSAEWGWLAAAAGRPGRCTEGGRFSNLRFSYRMLAEVEGWVREFLSGLRDEDLARIIEFTLSSGESVDAVGTVDASRAVHGVHHRGQVALLLRALGHAPGNVDILFYYAAV